MEFRILHKNTGSRARVGRIRTSHGEIETPVFMPVGTRASVKALSPEDLKESGVEIVLANTYHLFLRPGLRLIEKLGGLHSFMGWDRPVLTDSGGFQVYSLSALRSISEEGVTFRSHLDGAECFLGPREAMAVQQALGADIIMCFDECAPYPAEYGYVADSVGLTSRWAEICMKTRPQGQALFGIVQGGVYPDLRERSARDLVAMGFDGYALGGLSVGEDRETRNRVIHEAIQFLPEEKPTYLMGVGKPEDILDAVGYGVDMFDCVLPTRNARNGTLFTRTGKLVIKNACYAEDPRPVEEGCDCYTCSHFSRAYLRHLFMSNELLVYRLNSIHNVYYYIRLMAEIRKALRESRYERFCEEYRQAQRESFTE
ncbi:MAG: tRNA guanosine(34) transglycosylase Tgt [Deltaproteobacteria bacterium HGW-Deltaproteobacteria-15]|jgi:queuine tRNA-ribosyltransferase|nr:MAG: tRNA guanosine(34) transglycosylase Tgt [Deltaproteobacteria bacterium HGW-Deltaproteobacteria-15]